MLITTWESYYEEEVIYFAYIKSKMAQLLSSIIELHSSDTIQSKAELKLSVE